MIFKNEKLDFKGMFNKKERIKISDLVEVHKSKSNIIIFRTYAQ